MYIYTWMLTVKDDSRSPSVSNAAEIVSLLFYVKSLPKLFIEQNS